MQSDSQRRAILDRRERNWTYVSLGRAAPPSPPDAPDDREAFDDLAERMAEIVREANAAGIEPIDLLHAAERRA